MSYLSFKVGGTVVTHVARAWSYMCAKYVPTIASRRINVFVAITSYSFKLKKILFAFFNITLGRLNDYFITSYKCLSSTRITTLAHL